MDSISQKTLWGMVLGLVILLTPVEVFAKEKKSTRPESRPHLYPPAQEGAVGEQGTNTRKKQFGSDRQPAVLNLNDELEAISQLNARKEQWVSGQGIAENANQDVAALKKKELFFNKFLVVDDQVLLFGEGMTGLLTCKKRGGSSLVLTQGRQINTKAFTARPSDQSLSIPDDTLCSNAMTVFRSDPNGQTRLVVAETVADRVTRLDVR